MKLLTGSCFFFALLLTHAQGFTFNDDDVIIRGPTRSLASGDAELECFFRDNETATATGSMNRTVWWKDGEVIYTFSRSRESPQGEGRVSEDATQLNIDATKSDGRRLYLSNLGEEANGNYRCDLFNGTMRIKSGVHKLEVLVGLKSNPQLKGFPAAISADEVLNGNCTVPLPSNETWAKAIQLKFLINDKPVFGTFSITTTTAKASRNRAQILTSTLALTVESRHFSTIEGEGRQFNLTCDVSIDGFQNSLQEGKIIYDADDLKNRMRLSKRRTTTTTTTNAPQLGTTEANHTIEASKNVSLELSPVNGGDAEDIVGHESLGQDSDSSELARIIQTLIKRLDTQNKIQQALLDIGRTSLSLKQEELEFVKSLRRTPIKTT